MHLAKNGRTIASADAWFESAPPKGGASQWVDGRSAKECARAWTGAGRPATPPEIKALFDSHPDTCGLAISSAEQEAQIRFDRRRGEPRNADLAFLGQTPAGLIAGTVEAKADESFDALLSDSLADALERWRSSSRSGGIDRAKDLVRSLLPAVKSGLPRLSTIRYQLLTAVAGTLAWAATHRAARAVLVIHEFQGKTDSAKLAENARDLARFVCRLSAGAIPHVNSQAMVGPIRVPRGPLFSSPPALYIGKTERVCLIGV